MTFVICIIELWLYKRMPFLKGTLLYRQLFRCKGATHLQLTLTHMCVYGCVYTHTQVL